jgi:uncharacterized protein with HEPN domain
MRNDLVVEKMIQTIERIQRYCTGLTYDTFIDNDMVVDACVFNLSQLGELANRVTEDFEEKHSEVPWRQVYGLRNRIVHDYEGVNLKLVWEIIESDLPDLVEILEKL